jgi:hypothetical protein
VNWVAVDRTVPGAQQVAANVAVCLERLPDVLRTRASR